MLILQLKFIFYLLKIAKTTAIEQNNQNLLYALPRISYLEAVQKTFSAEYIRWQLEYVKTTSLIRI